MTKKQGIPSNQMTLFSTPNKDVRSSDSITSHTENRRPRRSKTKVPERRIRENRSYDPIELARYQRDRLHPRDAWDNGYDEDDEE